MQDAALRLKTLLEQLLGAPLPVRLRAWDGSEAGPPVPPPSSYAIAAQSADSCGSRGSWGSLERGSPVI